jgi:hypothetical protein
LPPPIKSFAPVQMVTKSYSTSRFRAFRATFLIAGISAVGMPVLSKLTLLPRSSKPSFIRYT